MKRTLPFLLAILGVLVLASGMSYAKDVKPMYGGTLIDGYDFGKDHGPKGSIAYNPETNSFKGSYTGLKMPAGQRAIFAWLHDTVNQKTTYLGPVGWLKTNTGGKDKGRFEIPVPADYKGGKFGSYEIIGFSAEKTGFIDRNTVKTTPSKPSASKILPALDPAFYLFAALPGAQTELHYCGHGQDFFYAHADGLAKQTCYD